MKIIHPRSRAPRSAAAILLLLLASLNLMGQPQWLKLDKKNIAQFKPAKQINTFEGGHANKAVDGNTDGNWGNRSLTHTHGVESPWWEVNLLQQYDISSITIYNRTDGVQERLDNFTIRVSEEPFEYNDGGVVFNDDGAWFSGSRTFQGDARGQYIRIHLNGNGILSLAEVVVNGTPVDATKPGEQGENLALGKRTRQSSVFDFGNANRGNDGDTNGNWGDGSVMHTQGEDKPWWEVDLGKKFLIEEVRIHNRKDCCQDRTSNFNIWVTPKPKDQLTKRLVPFATEEKALGQSRTYSGKQVGQFVRIELNGRNELNLAEVEVFGTEVGELQQGVAASQVMYKVSIFRNVSPDDNAIKSTVTTSISEGMDFNRTVASEDRTHWSLSTTARTSVNFVVASLELEISAGVGGDVANSRQSSQGRNVTQSTSENIEISQTVPGGCTRYEFHKFVINQSPMTYKFDGETYSWFRVNEKAAPAGDITVMVFPNDVDPGLNQTNDNWVLPENYQMVLEDHPNFRVN
ncbi:MAG: discoidin domain-containing protein [Saprospiraceae bacterium]|nr:discoidin domain-containing protein [Saprospiraceae bacterium]